MRFIKSEVKSGPHQKIRQNRFSLLFAILSEISNKNVEKSSFFNKKCKKMAKIWHLTLNLCNV